MTSLETNRFDFIREKLFAWGLKHFDPVLHRVYGPQKSRLLKGLSGSILEIGPGTGINFRYYPKGLHIVAVEPNIYLHSYLKRAAAEYGLDMDLHGTYGEKLNLPDNSMDAAVGTLVLCSVFNVGDVVSEIRRVLKPGGRFFFLEHVAAREGSRLRRTQQRIRPVWKFLFDGCRPDRETWTQLEKAGFRHLTIERFHLSIAVVGPHISGVAVK